MSGRHALRLGLIGALLAAGPLALPRGAASQSLDLTAPAPQQSRERIGTRPPDRSVSPGRPAFVGPLSWDTKDGRAGAAGWLSPNTPTGARVTTEPSGQGWLGIGIAVESGGAGPSRDRAESTTRRN